MAPRVDPVQSDQSLPARADVVIVGGGIIGTSTALFLAQKGVSAVLCVSLLWWLRPRAGRPRKGMPHVGVLGI